MSLGRSRRLYPFALGLVSIAVAFAPPLEAAAHELLSAHMVQHLVLIYLAAPLIAAGPSGATFAVALPRGMRRALGPSRRAGRTVLRAVSHPVVVGALNVAALWAWHSPALYQAALGNDALHVLEHLSFFGSALLFWRVILHPDRRRRLPAAGALILVFLIALQSGALGALLTFATTSIYPQQTLGSSSWGLSPLEDQQLAGILMWVPTGIVYLGTACALFVRWLHAMEEEAGSERIEAGPGDEKKVGSLT